MRVNEFARADSLKPYQELRKKMTTDMYNKVHGFLAAHRDYSAQNPTQADAFVHHLIKLIQGSSVKGEVSGENSLRTVTSRVKETDNYVLCVVTGDKEPMTVVVESDESAKCYRELIKRLFDIQYELSGYEPDVAIDRVQSYFSELRTEWLGENSLEEGSD